MRFTTRNFLLSAALANIATNVHAQTICHPTGWVFNGVTTECTFASIIAQAQTAMDTSPIPIGGCGHGAAEELRLLLGLSTIAEAQAVVEEACAGEPYPYQKIIDKGEMHVKEYFDGNTDLNEKRQTVDEVGAVYNILPYDFGRIPGIRSIAEKGVIEYPNYASNFDLVESCKLRAVNCCFVQDRQAGDGNGNCATPYDSNCVDADPADNTDICYADYSKCPESSRVAGGYAIFDNKAEGDAHCHGFAWAQDEADASSRFKGNNLFHVAMSDHFYDRGYVRNVPGTPMCACVEQMPVVTRADCTQVDVTEDHTFAFAIGAGFSVVSTYGVKFNKCRGVDADGTANEDDLEAHYRYLVSQGKASAAELGELKKHLVGKGQCKAAIASFIASL